MTYIVRELLYYLTDEQAFWAFTSIIEEMLPIDYYMNSYGMDIDKKLLRGFIAEQFPELKFHFEDLGFDMSMVGEGWMSTLLINHLSKETL